MSRATLNGLSEVEPHRAFSELPSRYPSLAPSVDERFIRRRPGWGRDSRVKGRQQRRPLTESQRNRNFEKLLNPCPVARRPPAYRCERGRAVTAVRSTGVGLGRAAPAVSESTDMPRSFLSTCLLVGPLVFAASATQAHAQNFGFRVPSLRAPAPAPSSWDGFVYRDPWKRVDRPAPAAPQIPRGGWYEGPYVGGGSPVATRSGYYVPVPIYPTYNHQAGPGTPTSSNWGVVASPIFTAPVPPYGVPQETSNPSNIGFPRW